MIVATLRAAISMRLCTGQLHSSFVRTLHTSRPRKEVKQDKGRVEIVGWGTYQHVEGAEPLDFLSINGRGNITGSVNAKEVEVNGTGNFKGLMKAGRIRINGHGSVHGEVLCEDALISGVATVKNGNFHCKRISVAGRLDVVRHGLGDGVLSVEGVADIQGCVSAARLEADKLSLKCLGHSSIGAIHAFEVRSCAKVANESWMKALWFLKDKVEQTLGTGLQEYLDKMKDYFPFLGGRRGLTSNIIRGQNIDLSDAVVKEIYGNSVRLRSNVDVQSVFYTGSLQIDDDTSVTVVEQENISSPQKTLVVGREEPPRRAYQDSSNPQDLNEPLVESITDNVREECAVNVMHNQVEVPSAKEQPPRTSRATTGLDGNRPGASVRHDMDGASARVAEDQLHGLNEKTVKQLREICRSRGLRVSGLRKAEIIERLIQS